MKIVFITAASLQTATADELKTYEYNAGDTATVPDEIAALFIEAGQAEPAKAERAVKAKGETATK